MCNMLLAPSNDFPEPFLQSLENLRAHIYTQLNIYIQCIAIQLNSTPHRHNVLCIFTCFWFYDFLTLLLSLTHTKYIMFELNTISQETKDHHHSYMGMMVMRHPASPLLLQFPLLTSQGTGMLHGAIQSLECQLIIINYSTQCAFSPSNIHRLDSLVSYLQFMEHEAV